MQWAVRWLLVCAVWVLWACNGPDPSLLRKVKRPDGGPQLDGGAAGPVDGGAAGPGSTPIDPGSVDGPTESIDCMFDGEFNVCTRPHAESACVEDECLIVRCLGDWVDCDGDADNGCETTLRSAEHCGRCGADCALANVDDHLCNDVEGAAVCIIDHACGATECMDEAPEVGCKPGFGDCDGKAQNGCEKALTAVTDCGSCGRSCEIANAVAACEGGRCVTVGCSPGFGDCGGEGCISLAGDTSNCGECGRACPAEAEMCSGGRCTSLVCDAGTADCNGDGGDGCEADLTDPQSCGICDNACPEGPGATAVCSEGRCSIECAPATADCDGDPATGCEADLGVLASCGACGNDCLGLPHVESASCSDMVCGDLVCEEGWDDCNGDPDDGCEQPLNTVDDCGACGRECAAAHGAPGCDDGTCLITSCDPGWDDCNGEVDDGCEANLGVEPNCGGCGIECGPGSSCNGGGCECVDSSGCLVGECCDGVCIDTMGACRSWPCIPGTNNDFNNCGGCGIQCIPFVHLGCCRFL